MPGLLLAAALILGSTPAYSGFTHSEHSLRGAVDDAANVCLESACSKTGKDAAEKGAREFQQCLESSMDRYVRALPADKQGSQAEYEFWGGVAAKAGVGSGESFERMVKAGHSVNREYCKSQYTSDLGEPKKAKSRAKR